MKVYLDDKRDAPDGWTLVRSVNEAKIKLKSGNVESLSLDYRLGDSHLSGISLIHWMRKTGHWPKSRPTIHTDSPEKAEDMKKLLDRWWPERDK
jgi:hypothetical protein